MSSFVRRNGSYLLIAGAAGLAIAWLGLQEFAFNDYDTEASASVHQLITGHLLSFLLSAPSYGGSLLLRAPFALAPTLWGGGELAVYRMLALPCLLCSCLLGVWLAERMRRGESSWMARLALLLMFSANPVVLYALEIGHPEEILAATLCIAAMLAACAQHPVTAGLALGLAVATKSSALIAAAPVLLTLTGSRVRASLTAVGSAGLVLSPFLIAQHLHQTHATLLGAGSSGIIFGPQQLWWFLGDPSAIVRTSHGVLLAGYRGVPGWLSSPIHPAIVLVSVPLTLLWRARSEGRAAEPWALLALVGLARCALDPWNILYYSLPFLMALAVWEVTLRRQAPLLSLACMALAWICFRELPGTISPDMQALAYLAWAVPLAGALSVWLYAPRLAGRVRAALGRAALVSEPTLS